MEDSVEQCQNGCFKYRQSIEEVAEACNKHREKVIALKDIAEEQKSKISILREEKYSLLDKVDQLEYDDKRSSDLILRMTRETRDLKIEVKNLRMKTIEQEETIKEENGENEEFKLLKVKTKDLEDELFLKDHKISELEAAVEKSKEMFEKRNDVEENYVKKENKSLKVQVELLEAKVKEIKDKELSDKEKRNLLLQRMDRNLEEKRKNFDNLKERMKILKQKSIPNCWFGIECIKRFCRFNHRFVYTKNNRKQKLPDANLQCNEEGPTSFLCERCGEYFQNIGIYSKHLLNSHGNKNKNKTQDFKCRECSEVFQRRDQLNIHVIDNHNEDEIECEQCEKFFVSRKELNDHRRSHANVDPDIESLNKMLKGILDNDNVIKSKCQQEENATETFTCDECNETFLLKASLRKHIQNVHKVYKTEETTPTENDPFRNNPNRELKCGLCVLDFVTLDQMDDHMDEKHSGRWKLSDPDVIFEGDEYQESLESTSSDDCTDTDSEISETQSGEDL